MRTLLLLFVTFFVVSTALADVLSDSDKLNICLLARQEGHQKSIFHHDYEKFFYNCLDSNFKLIVAGASTDGSSGYDGQFEGTLEDLKLSCSFSIFQQWLSGKTKPTTVFVTVHSCR